MKAQDLLGQS